MSIQQHQLACPNCQQVDQVRSTSSVYEESTSSSDSSAVYRSKLGQSLRPPSHPLVGWAVSVVFLPLYPFGWVLGWIFFKLGFQKTFPPSPKEWRKQLSLSTHQLASRRWLDSFYCRRCHRVFDPITQETARVGSDTLVDPGEVTDFWFR